MNPADADEVEWLPRTSGVAPALVAWVLLGAYVVLMLLEGPTAEDVPALLLTLTLALLAWVVLVRPRVGLTPHALVLQGTVSRLAVPWLRVEDVGIRRALYVFTSERRYVSPALARRGRSGLAHTPDKAGGPAVADHLVERLRQRAREAAELAGEDPPAVHREWDQLVLALLGAAVLASVVAALV